MQRENTNRRFFSNPRFLIIVLVLAMVFAVVVGTLAWLRHMRSMQTVTLIQVSDRFLLGSDETDSTAVNLGSIDVSKPGNRFYAFGVKSGSDYRLQLAYTTNIPFTYIIHRAIQSAVPNGEYTKEHPEGGYTFYYDRAALPGSYLNLSADGRTVKKDKHKISFVGDTDTDTVVSAQKYAEPVYWQSGDVKLLDTDKHIDYFVLEVRWDESLPNDKETDLIYLTVGAPGGTANETE